MSKEDGIDHDNCLPDGGQDSARPGINIKIRDRKDIGSDIDGEKIERKMDGQITGHQSLFVLIPKEKVIVGKGHTRRFVQSKLDAADIAELERIALITINNRIEFCQKYKTSEEEIGKCVCESLRRFIRLSRESRSNTITKAQIIVIKKIFEKMKKSGKIKCNDTI